MSETYIDNGFDALLRSAIKEVDRYEAFWKEREAIAVRSLPDELKPYVQTAKAIEKLNIEHDAVKVEVVLQIPTVGRVALECSAHKESAHFYQISTPHGIQAICWPETPLSVIGYALGAAKTRKPSYTLDTVSIHM